MNCKPLRRDSVDSLHFVGHTSHFTASSLHRHSTGISFHPRALGGQATKIPTSPKIREKWGTQFSHSAFVTNACSQPRTRFQPSP